MENMVEHWFANKWLTWGVGPVVAANLGTWPLGIILEWYIRLPGSKLVSWMGGTGNRLKDVAKTQDKVPYFSTQIFSKRGALMTVAGPGAIFAIVLGTVVLDAVIGMQWPEFTWQLFLKEFILMELIGDLGLYWGHRIQHEIPYFYKNYHSIHHTLETPTPLGAIYIHEVDAFLQGSLPMFAACLVVKAHPISFYIYVACRVGENILNHSGMDGSIFDYLFLKFEWLGRAKASHHDSHHKYGGHSVKPMNLGENFWIWDWLFGTLVDRKSLRKQEENH